MLWSLVTMKYGGIWSPTSNDVKFCIVVTSGHLYPLAETVEDDGDMWLTVGTPLLFLSYYMALKLGASLNLDIDRSIRSWYYLLK